MWEISQRSLFLRPRAEAKWAIVEGGRANSHIWWVEKIENCTRIISLFHAHLGKRYRSAGEIQDGRRRGRRRTGKEDSGEHTYNKGDTCKRESETLV